MTGNRRALLAAGASHPGVQREQNEDRWFADPARGVFCVVDGVGGHPGGEYASDIAVDMLRTRLARETGTPAERLREAVTLANNAIFDAATKAPALAGMTCVLTAAVVSGGTVTIGHVGDTRLYKLRRGVLHKLTHDHSPVGEREDAGELTEAEAMRHARRNEVYRDVGASPHEPDDDQFVEIVEAPFEDDAALLICSDGLTDQVPSAAIRRTLDAHAGQPSQAIESLIRAANEAGGKDNVTVVVVEGEGFSASVRAHGRWPTGRAGLDDPTSSASARREVGRGQAWTRRWVMLPVGVLLGVLATLAALAWWPQRPAWLRSPAADVAPVSVVEVPRTWRVGLTPDADVASIADALLRAKTGDTIALAAGDYREPVTIHQPITLSGPADAVIRPPLGAPPGWTAVHVNGTRGVRIHGLSIAGATGEALARGLLVEGGEVQVHGLRLSGATEAGVELANGGQAGLFGVTVTDNAGTAIVVGRGARLRLEHSVLLRNGTTAGRLRPGVVIADGAEAVLIGNAIGDNGGAAVVGWPPADLPALLRDNLIRPAPRAPQRRVPATRARPAAGPAGP